MAVFMVNICKFNGCGITFPRLPELIEHIEDVHIDYDPAVVEQKEASQPSCVPLSYVLKFITEASRRQIQSLPPAPMPEVRRRVISAPKAPSIRSNTPTGSEMDEDELMSPSEDSNDSWTTVEEYSSDYILRKANAQSSSAALPPAVKDKPFACPVPGCKKRYKNVNGIKYHSKNGHKKDGKVKKAYKCQCGKSYTTAQGLKSHSISQHIANSVPSTVTSQSFPEAPRSNVPKLPGVVVTASPANRQHVDGIDTSKLVRIYDSLKTKDLPTFTIPKHSLTSLNIVSANQNGQSRLSGLLTPNSTPGSSPSDKVKFDRSPRVTVQSAQSFAYGHEMSK